MALEKNELRLECLRLASGRSPDLQEVLAQAKALYEFVTDADASAVAPPDPPKKEKAAKKAGNLDDLL